MPNNKSINSRRMAISESSRRHLREMVRVFNLASIYLRCDVVLSNLSVWYDVIVQSRASRDSKGVCMICSHPRSSQLLCCVFLLKLHNGFMKVAVPEESYFVLNSLYNNLNLVASESSLGIHSV